MPASLPELEARLAAIELTHEVILWALLRYAIRRDQKLYDALWAKLTPAQRIAMLASAKD